MQARHQRGAGGQCPHDFRFCPPDFFLAPTVFLGGRSWCFWVEKTLKVAISARKSLRISAKTFFFFFYGDHLLLAEKFVISARKSLRISAKTFFFCLRSPAFGLKICVFGQKKPSHFGENLCPPDFNFAPPISRSWRRPCCNAL